LKQRLQHRINSARVNGYVSLVQDLKDALSEIERLESIVSSLEPSPFREPFTNPMSSMGLPKRDEILQKS
jgi:hypothetical protein